MRRKPGGGDEGRLLPIRGRVRVTFEDGRIEAHEAVSFAAVVGAELWLLWPAGPKDMIRRRRCLAWRAIEGELLRLEPGDRNAVADGLVRFELLPDGRARAEPLPLA